MKKFLALFLGAAMLFGVFAAVGCSKGATRVALEYTEYKAPAEGEEDTYDRELVYQNDLDVHGADPSVIYVDEGEQAGYFYMYVTGIGRGFECFRSKDLDEWESMGVAYEYTNFEVDGITYSSFAASNHWAPEVIYDEELGLYCLFYSAGYRFKGLSFYLDCAVSENPQGPFTQYARYIETLELSDSASQEEREQLAYWQEKLAPYIDNDVAAELGLEEDTLYIYPPLVDFRNMREQKEGETDSDYMARTPASTDLDTYPNSAGYMKVIDACPFIDPVSGEKYLYFVRDLGESGETSNRFATSCIGVIAMDDYWRPKLDENGNYESVKLLTETNRKNVGDTIADSSLIEGDVNEGPYMLYNEESGKYYLLFSANSYWEKSYSVRVAVGDSPTGPFTKLSRSEGGWLLYADPSCSWMSGTGHNSVVEKDGKQYIVYHAHQNRSQGGGARMIGFDSLVWTTNSDGLLIPHANGGSYSYMPQTTGEWSNIAPEAAVTSTNTAEGSDVKYLNDGVVKFHDDGVVNEFDMNAGSAEITLTFEDYREISALFIFNSFDFDRTLGQVDSVEFYTKDAETGEDVIAYTSALTFDWDKYYVDGEYIPGGSFVIYFQPMLVNKITIKLPAVSSACSISDIMVLGK